ncbi:MAG TPA: hypothetical protein VJZ71_21290 [Phycisphaerae bacterium]|nr:hypothetical protein [Phycisphaerae bacterium]
MKTPDFSHVRTAAVFFTVPLLLIGCAKPRTSDGIALAEQPDAVIILRGVAGEVFSKGMDELAARLQREGHPTIVTSYANWMTLASARDDNELPCKAIIGHSAGADHAIEIARALNRRGIDVDYLFLFDPRFPLTIPPNVRQCYNFMSPVPVGNSVPVLPDLGNTRTVIHNDVKWNLGHLDIDDNLALQNFIASRLRDLPDRDGEYGPRVRVVSHD